MSAYRRREGLTYPERRQNLIQKIMTDLVHLTKQYPDLNLTVRVADLREFADYYVSEVKNVYETKQEQEKYVKRIPAAEQLGVDLSTLWRYDKTGYLCPVKVGGKRLYKQSDIDKILMK